MLQHLETCQHLTTGEYICYECMKVEKFNDRKCCCSGHPTKKRRIVNMAKNFFSNIGHKSRRNGARDVDQEDEFTMPPPPPYESLQVPAHSQPDQPEQPPMIELNGREIIPELDSRPVAQLDSINYERQTAPNLEPLNVYYPVPDQTFAPVTNPLTPNEGLSGEQRDFTTSSSSQPRPSTESRRPSLALDTHIDRYRKVPRPINKYLSPSSSLRSTGSAQGISPMTPWSSSSGGTTGNWTTASSNETALTSPTSPSSPFAYLSAPQLEHGFVNPKDTENCPGSSDVCMLDLPPELPGDDPCFTQAVPRGLSDPILFSMEPKDNFSWTSSVDTTLSLSASVNMVFTDTNHNLEAALPDLSTSSLSTRTLIELAWDALQQHVSSSLIKVALIPGNSLARQLRNENAASVFRRGLSSLRLMFEGQDPHDPMDYLCFVHTIYAFSLVLHEDNLMTRCNGLFKQALAYRGFLDPAYAEPYSEVVSTIWQSTTVDPSQEQSILSLSRSSSLKGKEPEYRTSSTYAMGADPLIVVGQNFLDGESPLPLYPLPIIDVYTKGRRCRECSYKHQWT